MNHLDENKYPILNKYLNYLKKREDTIKFSETIPETQSKITLAKENKKEKEKIEDINDEEINGEDNYTLDKLNLFNSTLNLFKEKYSRLITRETAQKILIRDTELYKDSEYYKLIDQFIEFYNKLQIKDTNGNQITLAIDKNHLSDFVIDESNEIGKSYINIYKIFIRKQNEEINDLLLKKVISGVFSQNSTNKINIQQIKEDQIFNLNTNKDFSFTNIIFNYSYREIIDNQNYKSYNRYVINFDLIESKMTDLLLKNKKLLNEEINEFIYNNEAFNSEIDNLITYFYDNYDIMDITLDDKEIIYNIMKDNKGSFEKYNNYIRDFIIIIQYLDKIKKENKDIDISGDTTIYEVLNNLQDNISKDFLAIFENKKSLTVNKIINILDYFLKLIFNDIKEELKKYQDPNNDYQLEQKVIDKLNEYYESEPLISKEDLKNSIRLFMTLILFMEEDKENKIKNNYKNLINYLKIPDLWDKILYNEDKFVENLNELKGFKIPVNQIISFYNYLSENKEDNFCEEIENYIKNKPNINEDKNPPEPPIEDNPNVDNNNNSNSESHNASEDESNKYDQDDE